MTVSSHTLSPVCTWNDGCSVTLNRKEINSTQLLLLLLIGDLPPFLLKMYIVRKLMLQRNVDLLSPILFFSLLLLSFPGFNCCFIVCLALNPIAFHC